ncbi:MAG: hypothetical protein K8I00_05175 [Candidatus Omnitrophica bacterium]|nr:hypothetical protein [Candidatus Omnitrophota bacterium]
MRENIKNSAVADNLRQLMEDTFLNKCNAALTEDSRLDEREIIEYDGRMRVGSLEKFNGPCFTVGFNFYSSEENQRRNIPTGTIIYFIEEECVERLLKSLDYRGFDEDDQSFVLQHLGEFCQSVSEDYAERLAGLGYGRLLVSPATLSKNNLPDGMSIPLQSTHYFELSFHLWKKKAVVIDLVLAAQ